MIPLCTRTWQFHPNNGEHWELDALSGSCYQGAETLHSLLIGLHRSGTTGSGLPAEQRVVTATLNAMAPVAKNSRAVKSSKAALQREEVRSLLSETERLRSQIQTWGRPILDLSTLDTHWIQHDPQEVWKWIQILSAKHHTYCLQITSTTERGLRQ